MLKAHLSQRISKNNFNSFLWHGIFLALAQNFIDVDTIIPAMLIEAGGNSFHIGLLTAIMLGGSTITQLFFSPFLSNKPRKKKYLLSAINIRILSLLGLGILLYAFNLRIIGNTILLIFILISVFSLSGAFAAISYADILGKSILESSRKSYFSLRQTLVSLGLFISALLAAKTLMTFEYPNNYSILFIVASIALFIASLGFWKIQELEVDSIKIKGIWEFKDVLLNEIKSNKRIVNFLFLVNTLGISLALFPFLILYSKTNYQTGNSEVGEYLLLKIISSVLVGGLLFYFSKRIKYSPLLYITAAISIAIPIHILLFPDLSTFGLYFLAGGIVYTLYKVSIDGVLLEVSTNQNRTIYAGLIGAGSILPALFPLIGGILISRFGFTPFFILHFLIVLPSFYIIYKLDCLK